MPWCKFNAWRQNTRDISFSLSSPASAAAAAAAAVGDDAATGRTGDAAAAAGTGDAAAACTCWHCRGWRYCCGVARVLLLRSYQLRSRCIRVCQLHARRRDLLVFFALGMILDQESPAIGEGFGSPLQPLGFLGELGVLVLELVLALGLLGELAARVL